MVLGFGSTVFVALTGAVGLLAHGAVTLWLGLLIVRSLLGLINAPLHPASARMVFEQRAAAVAGDGQRTGHLRGLRGNRRDVTMSLGALIDRLRLADRVPDLQRHDARRRARLDLRHATIPRADGLRVPPRRRRASISRPCWPVLRRRSVICITLSYTAYGYFQYLFFYWIEYYFETIQQQGRGVARGYSTMITLAMGVGMISGGWLADRVPRSFSPRMRRALVPVLGMIASGVVFELGLLAPDAADHAGGVHRLGRLARRSAKPASGRRSSSWAVPYGGTAAGLMNTGGNAGGTLSPELTPLLSAFFAARLRPRPRVAAEPGDRRGHRDRRSRLLVGRQSTRGASEKLTLEPEIA